MKENRNYTGKRKKTGAGISAAAILTAAMIAAGSYAYYWYNNNNVRLQGEWISIADETELSFDRMPSATELAGLQRIRQLSVLDMRAAPLSTEEYDALRQALPDSTILWQVPFGELRADAAETELAIGEVPQEEWDNLRYMDNIRSVDLTGCEDLEAVAELAESYPDCEFSWSYDVLGTEYAHDTETMDLSGKAIGSVDQLVRTLRYFGKLNSVDLSGCGLSPEEIRTVADGLPGCSLRWTYELCGQKIDESTSELDLRETGMTDVSELDEALPYFANIRRIYLTDLDIPSADIEALADRYPDVKFVWRIYFGYRNKYNIMSDAVGYSTLNSDGNRDSPERLTDQQAQVLRYCTELEALDLGHNSLTDISFIANFPRLRVLILADNRISDISVVSQLKELEYVELFLNPITDASPLAELPKLQDLNLCCTGVRNVDPLLGMTTLRRLWLAHNGIPGGERNRIAAALPDCRCSFAGNGSTGDGWRDSERYRWMRAYFGK